MNQPTATATSVRPLPASGIALLLAYVAGMLGFTAFGWVLFAAGAVIWMKFDGKTLARLLTAEAPEQRRARRLVAYSLPPALAVASYLVLAAGHTDLVVICALAFHALLVWSMLMGAAYPIPQPKEVSHRI